MSGQVFYVYILKNESGFVEYVGQTSRPKRREYEHFRRKYRPNAGHGRFYGRDDLHFIIVDQYSSKEESYKRQEDLQIQYGLPTDTQRHGQNSVENTRKQRKFTLATANYIRKQYADGGITQKELANKYAVSRICITRILLNKSYKQ